MYACMKGNEGFNRDLFHIKAWFIKNYLKAHYHISDNFWQLQAL